MMVAAGGVCDHIMIIYCSSLQCASVTNSVGGCDFSGACTDGSKIGCTEAFDYQSQVVSGRITHGGWISPRRHGLAGFRHGEARAWLANGSIVHPGEHSEYASTFRAAH